MGELILIASYPKSGNTWMRFLLDSLRRGGDEVDLRRSPFTNAAARSLNDRRLDMETSDLTLTEVANARAWMANRSSGGGGEPAILKVHDALLAPPGCQPPFGKETVRAAICLLRDPRDVAVSFAHHLGESVDAVIARMADEDHWLSADQDRLRPNLPQYLSSWSRHVTSWLDGDLPVVAVRYEDMLARPEETLTPVLAFAGLETDVTALRRALAATRFEILKAQEARNGFGERLPAATSPFFRRGQAGGWRDSLTGSQVERIVAKHGPVMRRLGYLD